MFVSQFCRRLMCFIRLFLTEMEEAEPQETKKESKQQSDFVDSSCRVMMLQSYVQFLCVQKVLEEAAAHNGLKKI